MGYFASGWPKAYALPASPPSAEPDVASNETDAATEPAAPPEAPVIALHRDPHARYLLVVSHGALHVWSAGQDRALVGRFVLSARVVSEEGPFAAAAWSPDGSRIIAALSRGLTLVFAVSDAPLADGREGILSFRGRELPASPVTRPLHPLALRRVAEARVAHAGSSVTAACAAVAGAVLATDAGALSCLSWDGDILWRVHVPELLRQGDALAKLGVRAAEGAGGDEDPVGAIAAAAGEDDAGGVQALAYDPVLGFLGIVLGAGPALLLSVPDGAVGKPSALDGRWLRATKAASIALEPRRMLATVGLADGDVEQYYVGVPPGDICPVLRRLSLSSWYFEPDDVGAAQQLAWTPDGAALVVGWERRGLAVWSVSGCRLMWTLPQVGGALPTTPGMRGQDAKQTALEYPLKCGVAALEWGAEGLFLWAAPRAPTGPPKADAAVAALHEPHFVEFSFFKSAGAGMAAQGEHTRLALLGSDRVLLLAHADAGSSSAPSQHLFSWQHLIVPHDYLEGNWPPSRIAVNDDASLVAVAGEHGVAICYTRLQKWKVFGDLRHDRRIKCCALGWVGRTIVVGNEVDNGNRPGPPSFELLLYSRDALDATALQARYNLKTRPMLMDVRADGYLLVLCQDSLVYLFKIQERSNFSGAELKLVYEIFLPTREKRPEPPKRKLADRDSNKDLLLETHPPLRIDPGEYLRQLPAPGGGISEVRIFPSLDQAAHGVDDNEELPAPMQILLLRSTGSLVLLNTENMVSTPLLRHVERFWYTPSGCKPFGDVLHRPVWWAYGDEGLHVCFRDGMRRFLPSGTLSAESVDDADDGTKKLNGKKRAHLPSPRGGVQVERWFELDPEVYPFAIMSASGMILGATQGLISHSAGSEGGEMPCQLIQVKRQPILHTLLRHLLLKPKSDDRTALQVALKCVSQPQFADSLEWLLYEAVLDHDESSGANLPLFRGNLGYASVDEDGDEEAGNENGPNGAAETYVTAFPKSPRRQHGSSELFPRVIRLLKYFGEYEDIVVRCARKLDSKRWPLLFSLAGEPAALLEQCFMSGRLRTAACLLVILQEMWGFISSTPHSLRLVEAALDSGELSLAAELANFLGKADRAGMLNSSQLRTIEDVSWIGEAALVPRGATLAAYRHSGERAARIPAVDLAVLKHAHVLLGRMDFRNLAALAVRMEFPLAEWLRRERAGKHKTACPFVRDFAHTLLSLHRQFQYADPSPTAVRRARAAAEKGARAGNGSRVPPETPRTFAEGANAALTGAGSDTVFGSTLPPPPSAYDSEDLQSIREKARHLCRQELQYLATVARTAGAPDLRICFATLLLDLGVVRSVLAEFPEVRRPYRDALEELGADGYRAIAEAVGDVAATASPVEEVRLAVPTVSL